MRSSSIIALSALLLSGACSEGGGDGASYTAYPSLHDAFQPITLTTPESGGGERPVLAWEPVDGADHYMVVVLDPNGQPYWGWRTSDTKVRLGVGDRARNVPGPRLAEGMTWSVVANDAKGIPMAVSARQAIGP